MARSESLADLYRDADERWKGHAELAKLPPRELVIVAVARLDVTIAEALAARLIDDRKEATDFLGLNEDGRAPAGSFGSRIQLGYLLGLYSDKNLAGLRALKSLRNLMAHKVNMTLLHERAQQQLTIIRTYLSSFFEKELTRESADDEKAFAREYLELIRQSVTSEAAAARLIWFEAFSAEAGLYRQTQHVRRVELTFDPATGKALVDEVAKRPPRPV